MQLCDCELDRCRTQLTKSLILLIGKQTPSSNFCSIFATYLHWDPSLQSEAYGENNICQFFQKCLPWGQTVIKCTLFFLFQVFSKCLFSAEAAGFGFVVNKGKYFVCQVKSVHLCRCKEGTACMSNLLRSSWV